MLGLKIKLVTCVTLGVPLTVAEPHDQRGKAKHVQKGHCPGPAWCPQPFGHNFLSLCAWLQSASSSDFLLWVTLDSWILVLPHRQSKCQRVYLSFFRHPTASTSDSLAWKCGALTAAAWAGAKVDTSIPAFAREMLARNLRPQPYWTWPTPRVPFAMFSLCSTWKYFP